MSIQRIIATLLVILNTLSTSPALAECVTLQFAKPESYCVVMPRGEIRGVWFSLDRAEELRRSFVLVPELQLQIKTLDELNEVREDQASDLRRALDAQKEATRISVQTNESLVRDKHAALKERDLAIRDSKIWYRSPILWFGVGIVASVGAGFGVSAALK